MTHILHIDASARTGDSISRQLTDRIVGRFTDTSITHRDLSDALPQINETWVDATFTPEDARNGDQKAALSLSDKLVAELQAADTIVIGMPVYNFGVPAALKAWMDQVARAGVTFRYTENGPEGLLVGKRAIVAYASGGVPMGSDADFASGHLRLFLGFLGITDVEFIAAEALNMDTESAVEKAYEAIEALAA